MAPRYWVNDDADGDWEAVNNWSATDGGGGGAGIPTSSDDVSFTGSVTADCTLSANAAALSISGAAGYNGKLDAATFIMALTNDFTWAAGTIDWGNNAWTIGGNVDIDGTEDGGASAIVTLTGTSKTWSVKNFSNSSATWVISGSYGATATLPSFLQPVTVSGTVTSFGAEDTSGGVTVTATGSLSSSGFIKMKNSTLTIASGGSFSSSGNVQFLRGGDLANASPLTIDGNVLISASFFVRTTTIESDLTVGGSFTVDSASAASYILDLSTHNPNLILKGAVTCSDSNVTWNKGMGNITFSGANDQNVNFAFGGTVEDIIVNKSTGNLVMTGAVTTDSFTGSSTGTGDFDPNGQTITVVGNCSWAAAFLFDSAADCLNGCTWDVGGNFTADGQTLNATASWALEVDGTAVASGTGVVAYSNASGFTQIDASAGPWTDNGNNSNWAFGAVGIVPTPYYDMFLGAA